MMKINDINGLYVGYSENDDFRVLIIAENKEEATKIADEYIFDANLEGPMVISDYVDTDTRFDCSYALTAVKYS